MAKDAPKGTNPVSDAGVGSALLTTRVALTLQAARLCIWLGVLPGTLLATALWIAMATPLQIEVVKLHTWSYVVPSDFVSKWRIANPDGSASVLTVETSNGVLVQQLSAKHARQFLEKTYPIELRRVRSLFWFLPLGAILGYSIVYLCLSLYGSGKQEDRRLRGAKDLVPAKKLSALVRASGASPFSLVGIPLPRTAPMAGILVEGAQGTGKSSAIHDLMQQVFKMKGRKSIIYDHTGDYFKAYFRPGKDCFFNPALTGSVPWSIFQELVYTYDADTLGYAFLPETADNGGNGKFFRDAARTLFTTILLRLAQHNAVNTRDIATAILEFPPEELEYLIEKSVASSAIGGDSKQQRQGVIASMSIYLSGIAAVQPGAWSMRQFLEDGEDSRFYIVNTDDTKAMFAPLYRLMLSIAFDTISSFNEISHTDRYWFFLDEVHALGDIRLDAHSAEKRKYGVCIATGIQSGSQFVSSVGGDRSRVILNCFNTFLALRTNEADARERISTQIGEMEINSVSRNQNLAVTAWRDGSVLNEGVKPKAVVMASEFGYLPNCVGYLKPSEGFPATMVDYRNWIPDTVWRRVFGCRGNSFRAIHPMPPRDPSFYVRRSDVENALESIKTEFEAAKPKETETSASDASPAKGDSPDAVTTIAQEPRELNA